MLTGMADASDYRVVTVRLDRTEADALAKLVARAQLADSSKAISTSDVIRALVRDAAGVKS